MCGRYYIAEDDLSDELSRMIDELNRKKTPEGLKTSGEIFPSDIVPVLANSRKQDVQPFAMRWGYAFPNGRPIINARSETAAQKPCAAKVPPNPVKISSPTSASAYSPIPRSSRKMRRAARSASRAC